MDKSSLIDDRINRPYIERLRRDPRTRVVFDGFLAQVSLRFNDRPIKDEHEARKMIMRAAEEAIALAMAFVLDNDTEYMQVCEERDRIMKLCIDNQSLIVPKFMIPKD